MIENVPNPKKEEVRSRIMKREFDAGVSADILETHREKLLKFSELLIDQSEKLLREFGELYQKETGNTPRELGLAIVGGTAHGGSLHESSDIDIIFTADPAINPVAKIGEQPTIDYPARHRIARALHEKAKELFETTFPDYKEIFEIKGYGEQTPEEAKRRAEEQGDIIPITTIEL